MAEPGGGERSARRRRKFFWYTLINEENEVLSVVLVGTYLFKTEARSLMMVIIGKIAQY
jgi:hypothetical protein